MEYLWPSTSAGPARHPPTESFPCTVNRRLRLWLSSVITVAALGTAACSSDKPAEPAPSASPTEAPPTSAAPTPSASPTPEAPKTKPANNLDAIKVEGEPLKEPKVTVPSPWGIDETRTKVLTPGNGPEVPEGGNVEVNYYGVNGRTGEKFDDSFSRGQSISFNLGQVVPGFSKGLAHQKVGSRVVVAMPGADGYDQAGGSPQAGIEVGDSLIFVVDIVNTQTDRPSGDPVAAPAGAPEVTDVDGKPHVKIPAGEAPKELQVAPLIKGKGKQVGATDSVTVNYLAVTWDGSKVVDNTYESEPQTGALADLIPAWKEGLVGQTVGSRVLLTSPPDKAYPNGNATPPIDKGQTIVYVVDILWSEAGQ